VVAGLPTEVDIWMDGERGGGLIGEEVTLVMKRFMIEAPL